MSKPTYREWLPYIEDTFILEKNGGGAPLQLNYKGALDFFQFQKCNYINVAVELVQAVLKARRARKALVLIFMLDCVLSSHEHATRAIDATQTLDYITSMAVEKLADERCFVGACMHLAATIGVTSRDQTIYDASFCACVGIVKNRTDVSLPGSKQNFVTEYCLLEERHSKNIAMHQKMIADKKQIVETLADEDDRALEEFNSEFRGLEEQIPKDRAKLSAILASAKEWCMFIVLVADAFHRICLGCTFMQVVVFSKRKLPLHTSKLMEDLLVVLSKMLTFADVPESFPGEHHGAVFARTVSLAVKSFQVLMSSVHDDDAVQDEEGRCLSVQTAFKASMELLAVNKTLKGKVNQALLREFKRVLQTIQNRAYSFRVQRVDATCSAAYVFRVTQSLRVRKYEKEKSPSDIRVDFAQNEQTDDVFYFHWERNEVHWEHPDRLGDKERVVVFDWGGDFMRFDELARSSRVKNPQVFARIQGKDLMFLLKESDSARDAAKKIQLARTQRNEFLAYSAACQLLIRGIRRFLACRLIQRMRERVRSEFETKQMELEDIVASGIRSRRRHQFEEEQRREDARKRFRRSLLKKHELRHKAKQLAARNTIVRYWRAHVLRQQIRRVIREDESATFEAAQKTKLVRAEKQLHAKAVDLKNTRRRKRLVADIHRIKNDLDYVDNLCQATRRASKMNRYKVFRERLEDEITRHECDEDTTASFEEEEEKLLQLAMDEYSRQLSQEVENTHEMFLKS